MRAREHHDHDSRFAEVGLRALRRSRKRKGFLAPHNEEVPQYYYRARVLSALTGSLIQRDPGGYADGSDLYEYAKSRPTMLLDPTGQFAVPVPWPVIEEVLRLLALYIASYATFQVAVRGCTTLGRLRDMMADAVSRMALVVAATVHAKYCMSRLHECLESPWQPSGGDYGKRKDCGACFRECMHPPFVWPVAKCP